jgi:flavin-dependent dehydrogenase
VKKVLIVGGGLAGLISGIRLARWGVPVTLVEKREYPFHRVCGEYISNEAVPFLESLGLYPSGYALPQLRRFQLSSTTGKNSILPLDMGGFGISRFTFDHLLYRAARQAGVDVIQNTEVLKVNYLQDMFTIHTQTGVLEADVVIGSHGKRSRLDIALDRSFIKRRSPYVGVKYHIRTDHPADLIALHNFEGGYCGISNIEDGKTNLCYLVHRDVLKKHGNVAAMEREVLQRNPLLDAIFTRAEFLFDKPEVINEISFETKTVVEDHVLMAGDAAGMITPLCGNGMAMAIHAAKLLSDLVLLYCRGEQSRASLEQRYAAVWRHHFARRLWAGRQVQRLFGNVHTSALAIALALHVKPVARGIIRNTHGKAF